jgi:hypothetical protein
MRRRTRALTGCMAALAIGLAVTACGSSPTNATTSATSPSAVQQPTSVAAANGAAAGIPQHNGGDQDTDNNGGPSDGDGDI